MINVRTHIDDLLKQAKKIANGRPEKIVLLEEAVQLADSHNELELAFTTRQELVRACTFSGQPGKSVVAFSWCLAQYDKHPGKFDEWELMWQYKWIIKALINFPQVPLEKIDEFMEDAERRFEPFEGGLRALHQARTQQYHHMGFTEQAEESFAKYLSSPRGPHEYRRGLNNCVACEVYFETRHNVLCRRYARALDVGAPLVKQTVTCEATGKSIYALVLEPLVRLGRLEEAATYQSTGYPLVCTNMAFLDSIGGYIRYLTIINKLDSAVKLFEKHLIWALEAVDLTDIFEFYLASSLLFSRLRKTKVEVTLRLPEAFPQHRGNGKYKVQALIDWLDDQVHSIAVKFDARNKTDCFKGRIDKNKELQALFLS